MHCKSNSQTEPFISHNTTAVHKKLECKGSILKYIFTLYRSHRLGTHCQGLISADFCSMPWHQQGGKCVWWPACFLPSLSTHPHGCHTSGKPPVQPQKMLQKMPSRRSKISTQSDPFISRFQLLLTVLCSSEQSGYTAKPKWVCRRGGESGSGRVNLSVLDVGAAKPVNADWHKQCCIFIQQQQIWNFQNERWKIILIKNTSRPKSVCKGGFSLAITLEEHNVQSLKPQYVTSDVCCHSSFVPITSWPHRDTAQLALLHTQWLHLPKTAGT